MTSIDLMLTKDLNGWLRPFRMMLWLNHQYEWLGIYQQKLDRRLYIYRIDFRIRPTLFINCIIQNITHLFTCFDGSLHSEPPKSYIRLHLLTEKGLKLCKYGSPNTHSPMKRRATPLRPSKSYISVNLKLKRTWNYAYSPCEIQNLTPKIVYIYV